VTDLPVTKITFDGNRSVTGGFEQGDRFGRAGSAGWNMDRHRCAGGCHGGGNRLADPDIRAGHQNVSAGQ
jgi:hypothetical protein